MPYWKCSECHHEYEGEARKCEWCMSDKPPMLLESETPLEKMLSEIFDEET